MESLQNKQQLSSPVRISPLPRRQSSSNGSKDGIIGRNNSGIAKNAGVSIGSSSSSISNIANINPPLVPSLKPGTFEIETPTPLPLSPPQQSRRHVQQQQQRRGLIVSSFARAALHHIQSQWIVLVAGQVLSFLVACAGAAQATLSFDCNLSAPTFSLSLFYACLACCLIPICRESCIQKQTQRISYDLEKQYETAAMQQQKSASTPGSPQSSNSNTMNGSNSNITNNGLIPVGNRPLAPMSQLSPPLPLQQSLSSQGNAVSSATLSMPIPPHTFLFGLVHLSSPAYMYFFMALLDVYANYFTVLAFSYTTITSVTLLDALAIPSAMILSRAFLKREYSRIHLIGACLCMVGVILNVFQDYEDELNERQAGVPADDVEFPHRVKGDLIAIAGGVLFGASSVVGEVAVRDLGGPNEYVGMLGLFATMICVVQTVLLERDDVAEFIGREDSALLNSKCKQSTSRVILLTFVLINFINYIGRAWFLQVSEAAFLNLSLLTGDMWSVLFSVIAEKIAPHAFFYVALSITLSGVLVYEMAPSPIHDDPNMKQPHGKLDTVAQDDDDDDDDDDDNNPSR